MVLRGSYLLSGDRMTPRDSASTSDPSLATMTAAWLQYEYFRSRPRTFCANRSMRETG